MKLTTYDMLRHLHAAKMPLGEVARQTAVPVEQLNAIVAHPATQDPPAWVFRSVMWLFVDLYEFRPRHAGLEDPLFSHLVNCQGMSLTNLVKAILAEGLDPSDIAARTSIPDWRIVQLILGEEKQLAESDYRRLVEVYVGCRQTMSAGPWQTAVEALGLARAAAGSRSSESGRQGLLIEEIIARLEFIVAEGPLSAEQSTEPVQLVFPGTASSITVKDGRARGGQVEFCRRSANEGPEADEVFTVDQLGDLMRRSAA